MPEQRRDENGRPPSMASLGEFVRGVQNRQAKSQLLGIGIVLGPSLLKRAVKGRR